MHEKGLIMEEITVSYNVVIPGNEIKLFHTLARKMGWKAKKVRISGIDRGLEDIRKGNVFHAKDASDMVKQILENDV